MDLRARLRQGAKGGAEPIWRVTTQGATVKRTRSRASDATGTQNQFCMNDRSARCVRVRVEIGATCPPVRRPHWNSLLARKILHAIRANISPGLGKVFREPLFGNLAFSFAPSERVPISRGAAKPPRRARGRRARGPRARRARGDHAPRDRAGRRCARDPLETERRARDRRSIAPLPQRPRAVPAVRRRAARSNLAPPRRRASADRVPRRTADRNSRRTPPSRSSPPRPAPSRAAPAAVTTPRDARIPRRATDRTWGSREIPSRRARARWRATTPATTPAPRDPPRAMSTPPPRAPPRTARVPGASRGPRRTDEADETARVGSRVARRPRAARPERPPTAALPRTSPPCPRPPPSSSTSGRGARSRRGPPRRRTR